MLGFLALFLLSSMVLPTTIGASVAAFEQEPQMVVLDGDDNTQTGKYTYTDFGTGRIYDTHEMTPKIQQVFCAPSGYAYVLSIEETQLDDIFDEIDSVGPLYDFMEFNYYYGIKGTEVMSDMSGAINLSESDPDAAKAYMVDALRNDINGRCLLRIEEVLDEFDIYLKLEVAFTKNMGVGLNERNTFIFYGDTIHTVPQATTDYISPRVNYYQTSNGQRQINIAPLLTPGFFCEFGDETNGDVSYNSFGWKTDETIGYGSYDESTGEWSDYYCNYSITILAFNTIPIGYIAPGGNKEITYPESPIEAKFKLEFTSNGENHIYYSKTFILGDPDLRIVIDGPEDRDAVQRYSTHTYAIEFDNFALEDIATLEVTAEAVIYRLEDDGQYVKYCYDKQLPETGEEDVYYYIPSDHEIELHNQGKDEEFLDTQSEGKYYRWAGTYYYPTETYPLIKDKAPFFTEEEMLDDDFVMRNATQEEIKNVLNKKISLPVLGSFSSYHMDLSMDFLNGGFAHIEKYYYHFLEVFAPNNTENTILLNVGDNVNLLAGAGDIEIFPTISSYNPSITYYYDCEASKEGVIDVTKSADGFVIRPNHAGIVDLIIGVECSEFSRITKTIAVRVIDTIYDVGKIEAPDEFHYAAKDITVALNIRGITGFQNINLEWQVTNKKGEAFPEERLEAHNDASLTIKSPENDDYTIKAFYEGIEVDSITLQFRYVDLNSFLRLHVWWIIMLTLGMVALVVFISVITKRGKTTVQHIERVYEVFRQCLSNDSLSIPELKRIKREISRCLNRVEDLNIDALNQYEKATRYLRKSLNDTKNLLKDYDELSLEDKNVMYDRLDKDLSKALNVAKEIENAKDLIEEYHNKANRKNYETIQEEKHKKNKE